MRKKLTALLMGALLMTAWPAGAVTVTCETENGANGTITYIASNDEKLSSALQTRLDMDDALILLRSGAEITGTTDMHAFEKDGVSYLSLRFTQQGKIRFGRYGQVVTTVLLDASSGEETEASQVLGDMDALQLRLDAYVEETVLPQISTYLDTSELLPVPTDNIYLGKDGLTIHYPADRFSFFSGNSGAVEIKYYELADVLSGFAENVGENTAREIAAEAAQGMLPGVEGVWLDMTLSGALAVFGSVNDPDYIAGGEIYEVEKPALRGVQLLAARGAETDGNAKLSGIRSRRVNMHGLKTGVSTHEECIAALGEPQASVVMDASAAASYRVTEGSMDTYTAGEYILKLYYDTDSVLFAAEVSR